MHGGADVLFCFVFGLGLLALACCMLTGMMVECSRISRICAWTSIPGGSDTFCDEASLKLERGYLVQNLTERFFWRRGYLASLGHDDTVLQPAKVSYRLGQAIKYTVALHRWL